MLDHFKKTNAPNVKLNHLAFYRLPQPKAGKHKTSGLVVGVVTAYPLFALALAAYKSILRHLKAYKNGQKCTKAY